jgi:uncharacterized protein DUF6600
MMMLRRTLPAVFAGLIALAGLDPGPRIAAAQSRPRSGPTPPRLSFSDGAVSFWRPGAEDWTGAQVNTALAAGDALYAGDAANLEIQLGPRAFIRAGANTEIDLTSLDPTFMQFRVTGGHAAFDLNKLPRGQTIEIDTPNAAFTIDRPGYYRLDVDENTTAFASRRGGTATVAPAAGETTEVGDNQQIVLAGTDPVQVSMNAAPEPDAWDSWNHDRTAQFAEAPRSAQYVPPDVAGVDDLDRYGDWREQPRYGHVWVPRDVPPDWAPYSTGRWVYDPYYEWTWVDQAPWGWAPYHYGRWVSFEGMWGWAPGPVVVAPVYSPALVAFFGAPGIGVSVSIGLPFVSWCALGFGEPVVPWWGSPGFVGRPYWGGWGGPHVVNNVVINNTKIVNVTNVTTYQNMHVRNAVVAEDRNQFGRGRGEHVRLDAQQVQRLRPMRGDLRVRPVAASLAPGEARGQRPPDQLHARQVVATRLPQDSTRRLRAKGLETTAAAASRPAPRLVRPQQRPGGPKAPPQASVGSGAAGQQPPAAPGGQHRGGLGARRPAQPGQPAGIERPQTGTDASKQTMPPPPPGGARTHQTRPGRGEQAPPPVPGAQQHPPAGAAGQPQPPGRHPARAERPQPGAPGAPQRVHPGPPAQTESAPSRPPQGRERRQPGQPGAEGRAPAPPAASERAVHAPPREAQPSRVERPVRPQAPRQQRPEQPAYGGPPPAREAQPPYGERPAQPEAPPPHQAGPQQPGPKHPKGGDGKEAPQHER